MNAKRLRVAIVDDEVQVRRGMERLMRGAGFEATAWASGDAFLQSLAQHQPDCVVLDLHMPGLNGFDVLSSLQESDHPIPAIVITGHEAGDSAARARTAGAAAFLRKPVDCTLLIDAITRAVAERNSP